MPYEVTDEKTGKILVFDNPPTDDDIEEAFGFSKKKGIGDQAVESLKTYGSNIYNRLNQAGQTILETPGKIASDLLAIRADEPLTGLGRVGLDLLGGIGAVFSPVTAPVGEAVKQPLRTAGVKPDITETVGNIAEMLIPFAPIKVPGLSGKMAEYAGLGTNYARTPWTEFGSLPKSVLEDAALKYKKERPESLPIGQLIDEALGVKKSAKESAKVFENAMPLKGIKAEQLYDAVDAFNEAITKLKIPKNRTVTPEEILSVWRDISNNNKELQDYIKALSDREKISLAKMAMKGEIPKGFGFKYKEMPNQEFLLHPEAETEAATGFYPPKVQYPIAKTKPVVSESVMPDVKSQGTQTDMFGVRGSTLEGPLPSKELKETPLEAGMREAAARAEEAKMKAAQTDIFTSSQYNPEVLKHMKSRIEAGEAGGYSGTARYDSSYPGWFKNKGYTKEESLNAINKALSQNKLTSKQEDIIDTFYVKAESEYINTFWDDITKESGFITIPGKEHFRKAWRSFKSFWEPLSNLPEEELYLKARYGMLGEMNRAEVFVGKIYDKTKNLPNDVKRDMFRFLDGQIQIDQLPPNVQNFAKMLQNTNRAIGRKLVNEGLLSPEAFAQHEGQYIRYMYLKHLLGDDVNRAVGMSGRLDLNYLKQRKDLTMDQRRAIGLMEDVSVAEPYSVSKPLYDLAKNKFFNTIKSQPGWTWEPSQITFEGKTWHFSDFSKEYEIQKEMSKRLPNMVEVNDRLSQMEPIMQAAQANMQNLPENFVKIGSDKHWGPLANTFVRKEIYNDIRPVFAGFKDTGSTSRLLNAAYDLTNKGMAAFKVGKTALNLPTAVRNSISNVVQLNMSGMSIPDIAVYTKKSLQSVLAKDKDYWLALKHGLFKTNWAEGEIREVLKSFDNMGSTLPDVFGLASKIARYYGKIDDVFKFAKFKHMVSEGADVGKAINEAQKWGMDYSLAHPSIKTARKFIMPFVSYQYKIAPLIAESLKKNPLTIGKYAMVPYLINEASKASLDISDKEYESLMKKLPLFVRDTGSLALVPWKSKEGNAQWVNLEYFLPWQMYMGAGRDIQKGNMFDAYNKLGIGNPVIDVIYTVPKSAKGSLPPKDPFTGQEIFNSLDSNVDKLTKFASWMYSKWAPSMLTKEGAIGYTERAITGEKDRYGRTVTPEQAAGRWVGLNIVAPTEKQAALERRAKLQNLRSSYYKVMRDPNIKPEDKIFYRQEHNRQMQELVRGGER